MSLISEPRVETEHDGTLVFSIEVPCSSRTIIVEHDAEGRYTARADVVVLSAQESGPTEFKFEFVLPLRAGEPSWTYMNDVLRIRIPPR